MFIILASGFYGLIVLVLAIRDNTRRNIYLWLLLAVVLMPILICTAISFIR